MANSALVPRLRTPGVYIEEISLLPPSVAQVQTAIPVFIGYTARALDDRTQESLHLIPKRITSMLDYIRFFGGPQPETSITVTINQIAGRSPVVSAAIGQNRSPYNMYYSLQWYFINGGGDCWIVSVDDYTTGAGTINQASLIAGLEETDKVNEITLILFPDAQNLTTAPNYYGLYTAAIDKCESLGDRFTIMDVWINRADPAFDNIGALKTGTPNLINKLKYAAAYYPNINTNLDYVFYPGSQDDGTGDVNVQVAGNVFTGTLDALLPINNSLYAQAKSAIRDIPLELPPSPAIAGVYASVDSSRGVWKAPANVNLDFVIAPVEIITDAQQGLLNIDDVSGKSINVIRSFQGRGAGIVWGARTLAGNDNEWRYISVRRFFNMVEESVKNATVQFVFEPNDKNTWVRVKGMIDNFLTLQWRAGALAGAAPEQAFYVKVGLNETMTALDILEGRMIVEIGMAVVRPAEFIILQFMHKMQES